jgi:hypothetical protein
MIALRMNTTIGKNSFEIRVTKAETMDVINVKKTIGNRKWILICFSSSPSIIGADDTF